MSDAQACVRTTAEVSRLFESLPGDVVLGGPHEPEEVRLLETVFDLHLPEDYRWFLRNYGAVLSYELAVFGLGDPQRIGLPVADAILTLRLANPELPLELVPIEDLGQGRFACVVSGEKRMKCSPVVRINLARPSPLAALTEVAPCFRDYIYNRLSQFYPTPTGDSSLAVLEQRVQTFHAQCGYDHAQGGRLPRNYDWRPYRFCVQDVLLAATVVKHARDDNCLIVDVFLTSDIPEYERGAGARALAAFLLSEAFKCGGTMEIRFTRNVDGGQMPTALMDVALEVGVQLTHRQTITPSESRELYLALTGFSEALEQQIRKLHSSGVLSIERACYSVHHGLWTQPEVESIILGSRYPGSILGGKSLPEQRHLFLQDLLYARAAVLGGFLDRKLTRRGLPEETDQVEELEDTGRRIEIGFEPQAYAKLYRCEDEPLPLQWLADSGLQADIIEPGNWLVALIRARDVSDLSRQLGHDLEMAQRMTRTPSSHGVPGRVVILVPHDFNQLQDREREGWLRAAREVGIGILVCPETTSSLDADVARRLARSRILRQ